MQLADEHVLGAQTDNKLEIPDILNKVATVIVFGGTVEPLA
jgi:hypothetical protein